MLQIDPSRQHLKKTWCLIGTHVFDDKGCCTVCVFECKHRSPSFVTEKKATGVCPWCGMSARKLTCEDVNVAMKSMHCKSVEVSDFNKFNLLESKGTATNFAMVCCNRDADDCMCSTTDHERAIFKRNEQIPPELMTEQIDYEKLKKEGVHFFFGIDSEFEQSKARLAVTTDREELERRMMVDEVMQLQYDKARYLSKLCACNEETNEVNLEYCNDTLQILFPNSIFDSAPMEKIVSEGKKPMRIPTRSTSAGTNAATRQESVVMLQDVYDVPPLATRSMTPEEQLQAQGRFHRASGRWVKFLRQINLKQEAELRAECACRGWARLMTTAFDTPLYLCSPEERRLQKWRRALYNYYLMLQHYKSSQYFYFMEEWDFYAVMQKKQRVVLAWSKLVPKFMKSANFAKQLDISKKKFVKEIVLEYFRKAVTSITTSASTVDWFCNRVEVILRFSKRVWAPPSAWTSPSSVCAQGSGYGVDFSFDTAPKWLLKHVDFFGNFLYGAMKFPTSGSLCVVMHKYDCRFDEEQYNKYWYEQTAAGRFAHANDSFVNRAHPGDMFYIKLDSKGKMIEVDRQVYAEVKDH